MPNALDPITASFLAQFSRYLTGVEMRAPRTATIYCSFAVQFVTHVGGTTACSFATSTEIVGFLTRQHGSDVQQRRAGWNLRLSAVRAIYRFLLSTGSVAADPSAKLRRQRFDAVEPEPLSMAEMVRLVEAAQSHGRRSARVRNVALLQIFLHTGLRVAEVVGLNVDQVDTANYVLHGVRRKGGKVLGVALNDVAVVALEAYLSDRDRHPAGNTSGPLFLSDRGTQIAVRTVQQLVARCAKQAGIVRPVTPHLLRHSSATQLVATGAPLRVVQEICGHASVTTTERYVHIAGRDRADAVARLSRAYQAERTRQHGAAQGS